MPRHAFSFPSNVRDIVRRYVRDAVDSIDPNRYNQESAYCAALARALDGVAYQGPDGTVEFSSTVVDDRGPHAAESWSGTDLAITAEISDRQRSVRKAILVQAKRGRLEDLSSSEAERLRGQVRDMRRLTRSPKVLDIPKRGAVADPGVYSGNVYERRGVPKRYELADYVVRRVLTTMDGDTSPTFVGGVQDSGLTKLRVKAMKGNVK